MSSPEPEPDVDATHDIETGSDADAPADSSDAGSTDPGELDPGDRDDSDTAEPSAEIEPDESADGGDGGADGAVPVRSRLSDLPSLASPEQVAPVRRRRGRGRRKDAQGVVGTELEPPMPTLTSPLLSGRSLEPTRKRRRFEVLRDHPRWLIGAAVVLLVVIGLVVGKMLAENAADAAMSERAAELEEMLADATPEEFLAFSSGVQESGSLAERTRDLDGFVNVKATAAQSFIRFQPSGWWSGFTERCLVAVVREDGVSVTVPKTACIRVEEPAA